jgi:nucleotide-binding universal stress UspA family protein
MRVVVGYDSSPGAEIAAALVADATWAPGTHIRFVHAIATRVSSPPPDVLSSQAVVVPRRTALEDAEEALASVSGWLDRIPYAELTIGYGRESSDLAEEARLLSADLIVVGSRGRGPITAALLGSVSAELAEAAPCSVLVARQPNIERVALATNGSPSSNRAVIAVATWPLFQRANIKVVSVGDALDDADPEFDHLAVATSAARRIRAAGRHARATTRLGDPVREILELVRNNRSDTVVVGARSDAGLSLPGSGSTARDVLRSTEASVLICR